MAVKPLSIDVVLSLLTAAPPRIAAVAAVLSSEQLHATPAEGEWSANDILAHLRACADVWGGYISAMLAQEQPTLRTVSPRTWIRRTDYLEQSFHPSFDAFTRQRAELLAVLRALSPQQWQRAATMTGAGRPLVQTVHAYAQAMAEHERAHLKQLERLVAAGR